ncbi:MAG: hypothetical protein LBU87_00550, partial [Lactobacillales bacterium]|nr:hypothetical protein [Lactobacillales bacterium]
MSIQNISMNAIMSNAAYANFSNNPDFKKAKEENIDELVKNRGFTKFQAESFLNEYDVIYQYPDDSTSLSFTLFKNKENGQITISFKGTK